MAADAGVARPFAWHGDMNRICSAGPDSPERRGALMTERSTVTAGKRGGLPTPALRHIGAPNSEDIAPKWKQPPARDPMLDCVGAKLECAQLGTGDNALLPKSEVPSRRRNRPVTKGVHGLPK